MTLVGRHFVWQQERPFRSAYELRRDDELIGELRFRNEFGSLATAKVGAGCWTFKRMGFLRTHVTIRSCGDEADLATFRNSTWTGGGTLELPDGKRYRASTNFWHTRFEFVDEADAPLVRYHTGGFLRMSGEMEVLPVAQPMAELPWLVMLGWYLAVMMHRDSAVVAAAM